MKQPTVLLIKTCCISGFVLLVWAVTFTTMIGGEDQAIEMLNLPEFKERHSGTTEATLNIKSPVPNKADFYIHPGTPDPAVVDGRYQCCLD